MKIAEERSPQQNPQYAGFLTAAFALSYLAAMYIPLVYDYLNLQIFTGSEKSGNLVIQEHLPLIEATINKQCEVTQRCDFNTIFHLLEHKKMISSDYVLQMRHARELSISEFMIKSLGFLILTLTLIFAVARSAGGRSRPFLLVLLFVSSLGLFPIISGLPHSNGKFYYVFGTAFAVLISVSDGLTALAAPQFNGSVEPDLRNDALSVIHQKWTRLLILFLTIAVVFIGTVAVTVWNYMNIVFGYSFSFFPFLGVMASIGLILSIFYLGVLRNILRIQEEIEEAMGAYRSAQAIVSAETAKASG